ncbi:hypothetical protein, partial [Pseudomonas viridiflava]|uniref:hypothetical protein n=1 Tax=Pseudomonas viridiflava TaxID=33069 RepID=UPI002B1DF1D6
CLIRRVDCLAGKPPPTGDLSSQPLLVWFWSGRRAWNNQITPHAALSRPHLSKLHPTTNQESWDAAVLFH